LSVPSTLTAVDESGSCTERGTEPLATPDDRLRPDHERRVDHLAVHHVGTYSFRASIPRGCHHAPRMRDLLVGRLERRVDDRHLARMDRGLPEVEIGRAHV